MTITSTQPLARQAFDWGGTIDHLGSSHFSTALVSALDHWAGVEHYSAFSLETDAVKLLAAGSVHGTGTAQAMGSLYANSEFWRKDPTICRAKDACSDGNSVAIHVNPADLPDERMRHLIFLSQNVCDRAFICGVRDGRWYGVSMVRTRHRGSFSEDAFDKLTAIADSLVSLVAKHGAMTMIAGGAPSTFLKSVPEIEARLQDMAPALSKRETEVCARILRGISTPGIAVDLNVREESIATYRKRAYRRLSIGTRFELMQLYLEAASTAAPHGAVMHH